MLKRLAAILLAALLLAGILAGCSPGEDSSSSASSSLQPESLPELEPEPVEPVEVPLPLSTTAVNCLTGLPAPEGMQDGQRPVAVMVSNNDRSLPQRGLAAADVVFEMLTEGGITRLMAVYADYRSLPQVGPVRSTRDQFVQFAVAQNAILSHIGGSVYANNLINVLSYQDVDGIHLGSVAFWFDTARSLPKPGGKLNEYCTFTDAALLWAGMEAVDVHPTGEVHDMFLFSDEAPATKEDASQINCTYSAVSWSGFTYDAATGLYSKSIFGAPHTDEDGTPLTYTNVLMLTCPIGLKPDGQCTDFDLTGGSGYYFTAGGVSPITWEKGGPLEQLRLFDPDGESLALQRGKTFVGILPQGVENTLTYGPIAA